MDRKMIFFDIDGTLVPECTNDVVPSALDAIHQAIANGHLAFINSGRTFVHLHKNIKEVGFSGYCCGCGTDIYLGEKLVYSYQLEQETCREIIHYFHNHKIPALFEGRTKLYIDPSIMTKEIIGDIEQTMGVNFCPLNTEEAMDKANFTKLVYWKTDEMGEKQVHQFLSRWFSIIDRGDGMREIVPLHHSKATAIEYLCKHFDIPLENCYAIGDSTNDLPMLEYVPHAIAMGVSMPEILPYVEYQTDTLENDGIKKALEHYNII